MLVLKQVQITALICALVAFLATAGEFDLIDAIQLRLIAQDIGFCRQMVAPVAGHIIGGLDGTNP